jgi:hypothetical protein
MVNVDSCRRGLLNLADKTGLVELRALYLDLQMKSLEPSICPAPWNKNQLYDVIKESVRI